MQKYPAACGAVVYSFFSLLKCGIQVKYIILETADALLWPAKNTLKNNSV